MYGRPLVTIIVKITNISFICEYFPKCLYSVDIIILTKPGKSQKTKQILRIYKSIVLLNTINKIMEIAIYRYLLDMAEEYRLLLKGQMGNRVARSIELTIRVVIKTVYMVWQYNAVMSLLQLDIKGAFDTVNHI